MTADPLNLPEDDGVERPDWLLGAGEEEAALPPTPEGLPSVSLRRPVGRGAVPAPPVVPGGTVRFPPRPATASHASTHGHVAPDSGAPPPAAPRADETPEEAQPPELPRLAGLVGHEVEQVPDSIVPPRSEQFGLVEGTRREATAADRAATPPAPSESTRWVAAASSVPSLRRRRTDSAETPAPDPPTAADPVIDHALDAAFEEGPAEAARTRMASSESAPRRITEMELMRKRIEPLLAHARRVPRMVWIAAAVLLVGSITIYELTRPREHFERLRTIRQQAQAFDGQTVHVKGKVGQVFPVGGGYAFFLHQDRDTIVVFSRGLAPTERQRIRLAGTVSTGFLDGVPRAAIFESERETP